MDTIRTSSTTKGFRHYGYALVAVLLVGASYYLKSSFGDASFMVDRHELITATVQQGNFRVEVRASGVLKPQNIRWVSAQVSGRVEQSFIKAGAKVIKGQVLMQLSNPELHRELEQASWEFKATKAEHNAAYVALEAQLLDLQNSVVEADYNYQSAKLKLDAESQLIAQKNGTVSALDYQRSQLTVKQQLQAWQSQQQKVVKMQANLTATQTAQQARLGLVENNYQRIKDQVAALAVIATTDGVIQQVSLALGEQAQIGGSVALIADQHSLYAQLQVQEVKISDISLGQKVIVDTRTSKISGEVIRIDPAVNSGMVQVDVKLAEQLPNEARPDLTIDGLIEISNIDNALFVKRPVFAQKHSESGLYQLSDDDLFAVKKRVNLGQSSVSQIQIISGLKAGDEIVISDTTNWQDHTTVMIN